MNTYKLSDEETISSEEGDVVLCCCNVVIPSADGISFGLNDPHNESLSTVALLSYSDYYYACLLLGYVVTCCTGAMETVVKARSDL